MSRGLARFIVATVTDDTDTEVASFHKRAPAAVLRREAMNDALEAGGFGVAPYSARSSRQEWPLLVLVYMSPNREGRGRSGSTLYRLRCRRNP